jgi:hypothetical protein
VERSGRQWVARLVGVGWVARLASVGWVSRWLAAKYRKRQREREREREGAAMTGGDELGGGRLVSGCVGGRR